MHPISYSPMLLLAFTALVGGFACEHAPPAAEESVEGVPVEPPFAVRGEAEDLVLTWYDEEGPHTAPSRSEIPEARREHVRVDSLNVPPDQRDPGSVYVADLRAEENGRYPVRQFGRDAFDAFVDRAMGLGQAETGAEPEGTAGALASTDVIIYGASWCGACRSAAAYLTQRGVPFEEKDIERDPGARTEMQQKARAAGLQPSGIPVIDFRGTILTGFSQGRIDRLIQSGPRTL
ncbi:MAG: glutaredoxin family protein [Myxococcota bacterium]